MNEHIKHITEQYWECVTRGELQDDIVRSLREARELIEAHPAWQKEREAPPTLQKGEYIEAFVLRVLR